MPDDSIAQRHLALADRHIAETKRRIQQQDEIVHRLRRLGNEAHAALAEALLHTFQQSLTLMNHHRDLILDELGL